MSHSHMVIYQTSDGEPGSRQFDEIMAAVAFVEELRNRSGVDVARIFKLEEVKFEFKPYYQVLVVEGDDAASADEVAAPQEAAAPAATEEAAPVAAEVAADAAPAAEPVVEAVAVHQADITASDRDVDFLVAGRNHARAGGTRPAGTQPAGCADGG